MLSLLGSTIKVNYISIVVLHLFNYLTIYFLMSLMQDDLVQSSAMSEYDLAAEGDLFKALEPIIKEPIMDMDPMTAAISMISCGEDSPQRD